MKKGIYVPSAIAIIGSILFYAFKNEDVKPIQLLSNGDVEKGSALPSNWWSFDGKGKYNLTWSDKESFSPTKSLEISTQTADTAIFAFWAQTITNVPVGKVVTLGVKVKGNLIGKGISIVIRGDDTDHPVGIAEQFVTTQTLQSISGKFDWKDYSISLSSVNSDIKSLTIYLIFSPNTTGEVYFDDISLSD